MRYRAEIDGLRAIAIAAVLVYHAELLVNDRNILPGGFLGVDVFFVISGYLITSIILGEQWQTGSFSFGHFYERRARRLLPALILVILCCLPVAWLYLLPEQLIDFSWSALASLGFVSNIYWDVTMQAYGAESALVKPLLHTWSLAVEEQYYIIIPFLVLLLFPYQAMKKGIPAWRLWIFVLVFLASLLFAQYMTVFNKSFSFYMLPSRIWEMLAGSFLAYFYLRSPKTNVVLPAGLKEFLAVAGLICIILAIIFVGFNSRHPGFVTLIPVIGTALVLQFSGGTLTGKLLGSKVFVGVGLISYSLYLWHYPVFAFGRIMNTDVQLMDKAGWILLALILAFFSYLFVEKPFRNRRLVPFHMFATVVCCALVLTAATALYFIHGRGHPERFGFLNQVMESSKRIWLERDGQICHSGGMGRQEFPVSKSCEFINDPQGRHIVLVGDSHAATLQNDVKAYADANNLNYIQFTNAWCNHIAGLQDGLCQSRSVDVLVRLAQLDRPIVVYASRLPYRVEMERFDNQEGDREAGYTPRPDNHLELLPAVRKLIMAGLERMAGSASEMILIYPIPEQGFNVRDKLSANRHLYRTPADMPLLATRHDIYAQRVKRSHEILDSVGGGNIYRVYPEDTFCNVPANQCMVADGERIYYDTDNHLSPLGASLLFENISAALDEILQQDQLEAEN